MRALNDKLLSRTTPKYFAAITVDRRGSKC